MKYGLLLVAEARFIVTAAIKMESPGAAGVMGKSTLCIFQLLRPLRRMKSFVKLTSRPS